MSEAISGILPKVTRMSLRSCGYMTNTGLLSRSALKPFHDLRTETMKRIATIAFYIVGTLAILYLALYAYALYKGRTLQPGDPIHIFRNPQAPDYS